MSDIILNIINEYVEAVKKNIWNILNESYSIWFICKRGLQ